MIIFRNKGVIPIEAITTMGVSAKECERPIGYFGTGLKYAIAVLLRNKHRVSIWRGDQELRFGTARVTMREVDFDIVTMTCGNRVDRLGFTTELGKNWEMWQAFRELYCNAIDESGVVYQALDHAPEPGHTTIIVHGSEFEKCFHARESIVISRPPVHTFPEVQVHEDASPHGFYRGIAAAQLKKPSVLTWNVTGDCTLTEDRTIKYEWEFNDRVKMALIKHAPAELLETALLAGRSTMEGELSFDGVSPSIRPSKAFEETIRRLAAERPTEVNASAVRWMRRVGDSRAAMEEVTLTPEEKKQLERAVAVLGACGCDADRYPIRTVEHLGQGVLGMARAGEVLLSRRAFNMGDRQLTGTLFEEWLHLRCGCQDETRDMQNILVDHFVRLAEQVAGVRPSEIVRPVESLREEVDDADEDWPI